MPFYEPCTRVSNHEHYYKNTDISSYDSAGSQSIVAQFQGPILPQLIMAQLIFNFNGYKQKRTLPRHTAEVLTQERLPLNNADISSKWASNF
jgi:hypothetical protein